jgi:3,4-dihydroxy 2-butanone 4-phosphate synthase/GTP cyclohydrolase II
MLKSKVDELRSRTTLHLQRTGRPWVTLTYAQSLDGSIAARPGHPLALSGTQSQIFTHSLRAAHAAILVGIGTMLADNPRLSVRLVPGKNPQSIVLDSRLRFPSYSSLLQNGAGPWIATSETADTERQEVLEQRGAQVLRFPTGPAGGVNLPALLAALGARGINSLMVEGGAQVITSFLAEKLVDQLIVTIAPRLVGGLRVIDKFVLPHSATLPRLGKVIYEQLGEDLIIWGEPDWAES